MTVSIAHLGPVGTYSEAAALLCAEWWQHHTGASAELCPFPSIVKALQAAATEQTPLAVVPVENSIEGSVAITLDTLWRLDGLSIQQALVLPISHALLSCAGGFDAIQTVYSHPQALAQCQGWLEKHLPQARLVATQSTTEVLQNLEAEPNMGAIASQRAAQLYNLPVLAHPINDQADNCTRFWVVSAAAIAFPSMGEKSYSSLAFSLPKNVPGALVKPLQIFAQRNLNLSRIESRPTKRSLGEYLFFIDIEASLEAESVQSALAELKDCTETLKIFGSYSIQIASLSGVV
ncbi:MAG: prephenate dehydratase [Synechococcales bacterium]|nr:prephenate dehydratase [Synechococcales bacterium]